MPTKKRSRSSSPAVSARLSAAERRRLIIDTARQLFLQKGYADASFNDVIRIAGGSKATLIEQFSNKAGLFAAVIEDAVENVADQLHARPGQGPAEALQQFGETILRFYLQPDALMAYRGIVAEGARNPDIARVFYQRGHEQVVMPIARQLQDWHARGLIVATDFHDQADRFTHMLRNGLYEQHLLGLRHRATAADIRKQVQAAVKVLLNGLRGLA